jgi:hypothetical protein
MDLATVLLLIRTATNAASEAKAAYDQIKGSLNLSDETELRTALDKLRAENADLYESVQDKLSAAAKDTGRGPLT